MGPTPVTDKYSALGKRNRYTSATLEVTGRCNASCAYCFVKNNAAVDLTTEQMHTIIDKLIDNGVVHLLITGGEPFLRPDILDILQYAIDRDIWHITLYTNGTLLTSKHLAFLENYAGVFMGIQISLFSHDPATNDTYFGIPGALDSILRTVENIKAIGIPIQIALNILEETIDTFMHTANFLTDHDISHNISYSTLLNPDPALSWRMDRSSVERKNSKDFFLAVLGNTPPQNKETYNDQFISPRIPPLPLDRIHPCIGLQTSITICYDGTILPCNAMRQFPVGSILDPRPLFDILAASADLARLKAMTIADIKPCSDCSLAYSCTHCAADMMAWTGNFNTKADIGCNWPRAVLESCGLPTQVLPNTLGCPCN